MPLAIPQSLARKHETQRPGGMVLPRVESGILAMGQGYGNDGYLKNYNANAARQISKAKHIIKSFAGMHVSRRGEEIVELMMSRGYVNTVGPLSYATDTVKPDSAPETVQPVFNISVEGNPEYYANGILVHNCPDGIRYAIHTFRPEPSKIEPQKKWQNPALDMASRLYYQKVEEQEVKDAKRLRRIGRSTFRIQQTRNEQPTVN